MPPWRPWAPGLSHTVEFHGKVFETVSKFKVYSLHNAIHATTPGRLTPYPVGTIGDAGADIEPEL